MKMSAVVLRVGRVVVVVDHRMFMILLLLTAATVTGADIGPNLLCTNDYENLMSCNFFAQNCSEYRMTLNNTEAKEKCSFSSCHRGCCCSIKHMTLVYGENFTANVLKGHQSVHSKQIYIGKSIKPRTPFIISVNESNGNFEIQWKPNVTRARVLNILQAVVTYWKEGTNEKKTKDITADILYGVNYDTIYGQDLEPNTMYMVSVKTYTSLSGLFSDSSNEMTFTTAASPFSQQMVIITSLSITAVILSSVIFGCFVKLKRNLWDRPVICEKPKILDIQPKSPKILNPVLVKFEDASVEPTTPHSGKTGSKESLTCSSSGSLKSSGISTGSCSSSYANTEPVDFKKRFQEALMKTVLGQNFASLGPVSPGATNLLSEGDKDSGLQCSMDNPCDVRAGSSSSGSSYFYNKTYSILVPNSAQQVSTGASENQKMAEMPLDPSYHPSEADMSTCAVQPLINLSPVASSAMTIDMSYQLCNNADSGRFSYAEDSSQSSLSNGSESQCDRFTDPMSESVKRNIPAAEVIRCDENPCYGGVPQDSQSVPLVDYDYQAFQSVVEQPDIVIPELRYEENAPDESQPILPEIMTNAQSTVCLPENETPILAFISADQSTPMFVESGYQIV